MHQGLERGAMDVCSDRLAVARPAELCLLRPAATASGAGMRFQWRRHCPTIRSLGVKRRNSLRIEGWRDMKRARQSSAASEDLASTVICRWRSTIQQCNSLARLLDVLTLNTKGKK
jgi:hypothetical protein